MMMLMTTMMMALLLMLVDDGDYNGGGRWQRSRRGGGGKLMLLNFVFCLIKMRVLYLDCYLRWARYSEIILRKDWPHFYLLTPNTLKHSTTYQML